MKIRFLILTLATVFLFLTGAANASEIPNNPETEQKANSSSLSLGYGPVSQELHINPGQTFTDKITVWNLAESEIEYFITIRGFKQIEDYPGTATLLSEEEDLNSKTSASSWFLFESESVVIPPQHNFELNYAIQVPEDVLSGEYYAQVFFYTDQQPANQQAVQTINNLGGGPTFLIKTGDEFLEEMEILEFKSLQKIYESPDIAFSTSIANTGNTHLKPKGVIVLTNMFGQELGSVNFNSTGQAIMRDTLATYISQWGSNYLLTDEGKLAVGPITAELTINYKSDTPGYYPMTAETTFWIIQWKLALAILGAIIVLVWARKATKKDKKTEQRENSPINEPILDTQPTNTIEQEAPTITQTAQNIEPPQDVTQHHIPKPSTEGSHDQNKF